MKSFKQYLSEGIKMPKSDKEYTQKEAASLWKIDINDVIFSDRVRKILNYGLMI